MSLAAYAIAVRNHLRSNLTEFYSTTLEKNTNCRVMEDEKPVPNCGQEFIAIYGNAHHPGQTRMMTGIEELYDITVAVTLRVANVPKDRRGEASYVDDPNDSFTTPWMTLEERCREIIGMLDKNYTVLLAANQFFTADNGFTEPLLWLSTDAKPKLVGADHFYAHHEQIPGSDDVFGMLMEIRFGEAVRLQETANFDTVS